MKSNVEIIQETIEQIVNQKKIDLWNQYFSADYIARGAPYIGMGIFWRSSKKKHIIKMIIPGSPVEGKLQAGDELLWLEDEHRRWTTYEEIERAKQGRKYRVGVLRGNQTLEYELARDLFRGFFDTHNARAKSDMRKFMTNVFPDLKATITLILADGDMVVSLLEYRGTHAKYKREAVWREAWFARLSEGKIVESWPVIDESSISDQLGFKLIPPSS